LVHAGSALDLSLPFAGILNYAVFFLYPSALFRLFPKPQLILFGLSITSLAFSLYLLFVLKVILEEFCMVCTLFHVVNFSMFAFGALPEFNDPQVHVVHPRKHPHHEHHVKKH
jgi:uncharacterized membrane protein